MNRMQGLAIAALCWLALPAPQAQAQSFDSVVGRVESRLGIRRMRMPGMGFLVNTVMFAKKPAGASSMKMAIFDEESGLRGVGSDEFQQAVRAELGSDWKPMLQVRSRRDGEAVTAYVRISNSTCEMLVATSEREEGTIIQMKLDGRKMMSWLADNTGLGHRRNVDIQ
jgi:hypothetical protein